MTGPGNGDRDTKGPCLSTFSVHQVTGCWAPPPVSQSLGWGIGICISNWPSGEPVITRPGIITLGEPWLHSDSENLALWSPDEMGRELERAWHRTAHLDALRAQEKSEPDVPLSLAGTPLCGERNPVIICSIGHQAVFPHVSVRRCVYRAFQGSGNLALTPGEGACLAGGGEAGTESLS